MFSKYFNAEIVENLRKRVLSQDRYGRFNGRNRGETYVIYVSTDPDERLTNYDVQRQVRSLFVTDNECTKTFTVPDLPSCTRLTDAKIKKIIMGTEVPIEDDDMIKIKKSISYSSKPTDLQSTRQFNKENSIQLVPDSMVAKNSAAGNQRKVNARISKANSYYRKSQSGVIKTVRGRHQHFEPNTKCSSRQQEDRCVSPSDLCELEQLLQKLTLLKENRQLGGSVQSENPLDKQILNVIMELESLIKKLKQRPLTLTDLFVRQARLRYRKHILGCAVNTWNTLGNVNSLRNICFAVRSCVALLRDLFRDNGDPNMTTHQYDNEDNMSPTLLGPSFDEPLLVVVDRLYYAYLWLFNSKSLGNPSSQL